MDIMLVSGHYDAGGGQDPRGTEWPPHPARVISALRSVAADDEVDVLRELEQLRPPTIHASGVVSEGRSRSYVVTNTLAQKGGNLTHLGRTSGLRERRSVFPPIRGCSWSGPTMPHWRMRAWLASTNWPAVCPILAAPRRWR